MNKVKKLQKGMTLVEIVVAMSIFSIGTAAVTMAFAGAVKYNVHNQRRDAELSIQQDELQRGKADGLEIYGGHINSEIVFTPSGGTEIKFMKSDGSYAKPFMGVTEYQAVRSGKNDTKFDFQLKTFSTTPLSSDKLIQNREDDQYKISVTNMSSVNYDVDITIDAGTLYQGDISSGSGYKHASPLYHQSLAPGGTTSFDTKVEGEVVPVQHAPDKFEIGYIRTGMASISEADSPMTISFSKEGFIYKQIKVSPAGLTEGMGDPSSTKTGWCEVTIQDGGKITYAYK